MTVGAGAVDGGGTLPVPVTLHRWGLAFDDRQVEAEYRVWRLPRVAPFLRLAFGASFFNWSVFLVFGAWVIEDNYRGLVAVGVPVLVVQVLAAALTYWRWAAPSLVPLTAAANTFTGSAGAWATHQTLGYGAETGMLVAATLTATFFAFTIYRRSPLWATLSYLPYGVLTVVFVVGDFRDDQIGRDLLAANVAFLALAAITGFLACCVIENLDRKGFRDERLILEQRAHLERSATLIRRYVPPAVAERITAGAQDSVDVPQRRRVTILFSDIVGFTDIADRVDPETLTQVVGEYMATMAGIVEAHQGTLNEFAGDGLMALFGAPVELPVQHQALSAVAAAQVMQAALPGLNAGWRKLGLGTDLTIRIGINTGMASVGSYGSAGRMTYTAIGLQTNIAARIQAHCEPGGILLSEATWQLAGDQVPADPAGDVVCKGVHFPVSVYAPSS